MGYSVKEIFYTLQGEGAQTGRAAVFCRFAGCNLWSGREDDRANAACKFCDTDFVGTNGIDGGRFPTARELGTEILAHWLGESTAHLLVVFTGGEPSLQLDRPLADEMHARGFEIAIETNGTIPIPAGLDWVCVSPKARTALAVRSGNELKLVFPQPGIEPRHFEGLDFRHFFLQPMDGPEVEANTRLALLYCLQHPRWRLSIQTHKLLGIP
jgi:7-carboxy-7-deazaguanine synthase